MENSKGKISSSEQTIDFIVFETERLFVREFNIDDIDSVFKYSGDSENTYFMDWGPESRENVIGFIHSRLAAQIDPDRSVFDFAVCLKETGELIGAIGLFMFRDRMQADLGYIFNKDFWGQGYAAEAARGMLKFGFMNIDLHRITARCDSANQASENVMKAVGMRFEGEMKSSVYTNVNGRKQWRSEKHYALLQREFLNKLIEGRYA